MDYEVEARAHAAIEQLKYRYWRACDAKDPRGFRECFVATGGVLDFGPLGRTDPDTMVGIFKQIALATAADGGDATFEKAYNGLQGWVDCFPKAKLCGLVVGEEIGDPKDAVNHPDVMEKAYELGKEI